MNSARRWTKRGFGVGLIAFLIIAAFLTTAGPASAGEMPLLLDQCVGVDHFWDPADYPFVDPNRPDLAGAPSIIILGFTFDLAFVPEGSTVHITYSDGVEVEGAVDDLGKSLVIRGISQYGDYPWADEMVDPEGNIIGIIPSGSVSVDASEPECNKDLLMDSPIPATEPPPVETEEPVVEETEPPMVETEPLVAETEPPAVETEPPVIPVEEEPVVAAEEGGFDLPLFGPTPAWIVYLCCLIILVLLVGGTVVIVIRRRRRGEEMYSNGPSGVDEDLIR